MTKEEIKKVVLNCGSDSLYVFGGEFEGGVSLQQVPNEITDCLYHLTSTNNKFTNWIEIGCAAGGNTYLFNKIFNFDKIVLVDNNMHSKHINRPNNLKDVEYTEFVGDSQTQ